MSDHEETQESGTAGLPDKDDVPHETLEEIEEERKRRLDEANRPDSASVDNTHRTFDSGSGRFTDDPGYDPQDRPFAARDDEAPEPEQSTEPALAEAGQPTDASPHQGQPAEPLDDQAIEPAERRPAPGAHRG